MSTSIRKLIKTIMYPEISHLHPIFEKVAKAPFTTKARVAIALVQHPKLYELMANSDFIHEILNAYYSDVLWHHTAFENTKVHATWGLRNTGSKRKYICYYCNSTVDTESARYRPTKHAKKEMNSHLQKHTDELSLDLAKNSMLDLHHKMTKQWNQHN